MVETEQSSAEPVRDEHVDGVVVARDDQTSDAEHSQAPHEPFHQPAAQRQVLGKEKRRTSVHNGMTTEKHVAAQYSFLSSRNTQEDHVG